MKTLLLLTSLVLSLSAQPSRPEVAILLESNGLSAVNMEPLTKMLAQGYTVKHQPMCISESPSRVLVILAPPTPEAEEARRRADEAATLARKREFEAKREAFLKERAATPVEK